MSSSQTSKLLIGWSETDTTPEGKVDLFGQYYHRLSTGIHSRLSATVLALESDHGEQAVMVALDVALIDAEFQAELRAMLRPELPELDGAGVILNAIHTHNAPSVKAFPAIAWLVELPDALPAMEYRQFLLEKLRAAVIAAWRGRKPGGIARALGSARVGHCRRAVYTNGTAEMYGRTDRDDFLGIEGGEDSGVDLLFTFDENKKPTGVVVNLACPAQAMERTHLLSSDFTGEAKRLLQQRFGKNFRMLGQVSASGCQSPRDLTRNYRGEPDFWNEDGVAEIGRRLDAAVADAFPKAAENIDFAPVLCHRVKPIALPRRRVSNQDVQAAREGLRKLEAALPETEAYRQFCEEVHRNEKVPGHPGPYDSKLHHFVLIQNLKAVVAREQDQDRQPEYPMELHAVRLGEAVFVTNPFELYLDFGHQIKARSAAEQTFIVQLCGGIGGYLPNARAEQLGGYGGLVINGEVGAEGGRKLVDLTVEEIRALWE